MTQCTTASGGRQVTAGVHEARLAAARAAQAEPETKALLRRRSKERRSTTSRTSACAKPATGADEGRAAALLAATVADFKRLGVLGAFDAGPTLAIAA